MNRKELVNLLALDDFSEIYRKADEIRRQHVGDEVKIRAIIEFSNICRRRCKYCGINGDNKKVRRYRMTPEEIIATADRAVQAGYKTIVLQSGEDPGFAENELGEIIREIKKNDVAVTVSCGELSRDCLRHLRQCGADRYLLKHETADPELYRRLHPAERWKSELIA